jgi:hypothetical protein
MWIDYFLKGKYLPDIDVKSKNFSFCFVSGVLSHQETLNRKRFSKRTRDLSATLNSDVQLFLKKPETKKQFSLDGKLSVYTSG